jgi:hypothetical protein
MDKYRWIIEDKKTKEFIGTIRLTGLTKHVIDPKKDLGRDASDCLELGGGLMPDKYNITILNELKGGLRELFKRKEMKNYIHNKLIVYGNNVSDKKSDEAMLRLGFTKVKDKTFPNGLLFSKKPTTISIYTLPLTCLDENGKEEL